MVKVKRSAGRARVLMGACRARRSSREAGHGGTGMYAHRYLRRLVNKQVR